MLLIDATGYGDNGRFDRINEGVELLLQGIDNSAVITRNIGSGVSTHLSEELSNRHISFADLRIGNLSDADAFFIAQSEYSDRELLVIDDAEQLDNMPEMVKVLQGFEEGGIKLLYITLMPLEAVTIPEDKFILAAGNIPQEEIETPAALKDRFIHVELKVEGPKPGQTYREYLQEQSGLFHG